MASRGYSHETGTTSHQRGMVTFFTYLANSRLLPIGQPPTAPPNPWVNDPSDPLYAISPALLELGKTSEDAMITDSNSNDISPPDEVDKTYFLYQHISAMYPFATEERIRRYLQELEAENMRGLTSIKSLLFPE